ncbi:MAG TPA: glycosyltransferase family 4 protein [Acetobacteraceae bacterium]|nr:glycosyltransferase family 4 protein [Acetobacteraceae bacterium]
MKVLHVMPFPGIGGTEVATRRIADAVLPFGVRGTALLLQPTKEQITYFEDAGIPCLTGFRRPEPSFVREAPRFLRDSWAIARACTAFDVVHCADVTAAYRIAVAGRLARRPVLCHVRNRQVELARRSRIFIGLANHFVFVSSNTQKHFPMRFPKMRTSIVYDGVETPPRIGREEREASAAALRAEFGLPADTMIAGMFARVNPQKDYGTLIRAAAILRDQHPRLRFLVVGDNDRVPLNRQHFKHVQELARAAGVLDRFIFTGHRDDVQRLMLAIDICVLCTHFEGLPLVLLEAMAVGLPCVATAVDGIPEALTDGVTGLLHAHGDATGLAAAIVRLVGEDEFAKILALNARGEAERRFGQERFARDMYTLYTRLGRA